MFKCCIDIKKIYVHSFLDSIEAKSKKYANIKN